MDYEQRKEYRIEHVKPILEDLKTFAEKTALEVTPKSDRQSCRVPAEPNA